MKKVVKLFFLSLVLLLLCSVALAHSGKTDSSGGHYDRSTGEYHYHHGYPAHQHDGGVCPYDFDDQTGKNSGSSWRTFKITATPTSKPAPVQQKTVWNWIKEHPFLVTIFGLMLFPGLCLCFSKRDDAQKDQQFRESWMNPPKHTPQPPLPTIPLPISKPVQVDPLPKRSDPLPAPVKRPESKPMPNPQPTVVPASLHTASQPTVANPARQRIEIHWLHPADPKDIDLSDGVAYIADQPKSVYHYNEFCGGGYYKRLVSVKFAKSLGLHECKSCSLRTHYPLADLYVVISKRSKYYHKRCCLRSMNCAVVLLSKAKILGKTPCPRCKPPKENPKVWF